MIERGAIMMTELGNITHQYWWDDGFYFRTLLNGQVNPIEVWSSLFGWAPSANVTRRKAS